VLDPAVEIEEAVALVDVDNTRSRLLFERTGFEPVEIRVGSSERRDGTVADEVVLRFPPRSA
jgi:hypothetical protein